MSSSSRQLMEDTYKYTGEWYLKGRGLVVTLNLLDNNLPTLRSKMPKFIGQHIWYKGKEYKIRGVESFAIMNLETAPNIGFLLTELKKDDNRV